MLLGSEGVAATYRLLQQVLLHLAVIHSLMLLLLIDELEVISILIAGCFVLAIIDIKV